MMSLKISKKLTSFAGGVARPGFLRVLLMSIAGQILPLAAIPILTRLYTPADFGVFAVFFAVVSVLGAVAGLRLEQGIVTERTSAAAAATLSTALITCWAVASMMGLAGYSLMGWLDGVDSTWRSFPFWVSVVLTAVALSSTNAFTLVALRAEEYVVPAWAKLAQGAGQALVPIAAGMFGSGPVGLILGQMLGFMVGVAVLFSGGFRLWQAGRPYGRSVLHAAWKRQRLYRLFAAPALLLNSGSKMLPVIVLAMAWGDTVAGQVAVAQRLLSAPARLLGQTVSQFYIARAAPLSRTDLPALRTLYLTHVVALSTTGGLFFIPILLVQPDLVALVLGEEWRNLKYVMNLLVLMSWADFVLFPVGQTFNLVNRHRSGLAIDSAHAVMIVALFSVGAMYSVNENTVILLWSVITCSFYMLYLALGYKILSNAQ